MASNINTSRRVTTNSDDSPEVKKLRLEERAKHYLNGSTTEMDSFLKLNKEFDKGNLSAEALLDSYNSLFTSPNADVHLLVRNLAETYPANSNKYRSLEAIYLRHEQQLNRNATLPSLSSDSNPAPTFNSVWSANNNHISSSHGRNVNPLNLPSLKSPPASHDIFASPYKAASYKNLNANSNRSSPAPTPVVRTASPQANANIKPSYLNKNPSKVRSSTALSSQNNKLAALDLPSLPTPKPKVYIPPVNRPTIPDPKQWGKSQSPQPSSQDPLEELLSGSNTGSPSSQSSSRKKDKRKQLLFHIGI